METFEMIKNVDEKVKGFCEQLSTETGKPKWKKYNSKWSILKNYVRSGSAKLMPDPETKGIEMAWSAEDKPAERKLSVRFSNTVFVQDS